MQKYALGQKVFYLTKNGYKIEITYDIITSVELKKNIIYYTLSTYPVREEALFATKNEAIDEYIRQLNSQRTKEA